MNFLIILGTSFLIIFLIYFLFKESFTICLEHKTIFLTKLPENFEGLKIIQISDLHSRKFGKREKRVLEIMNQQKADFIFITGDINEARKKRISSCIEFWKKLGELNIGNVYAVLGNHIHENRKIEPDVFRNILKKSGIKVLDNENVKLSRGEQYVWLLGVDDPHTHNSDLAKAYQGTDDYSCRILLAHSLDIMEDIKFGDMDLVLVGHTHGGQVKILGIRPFWVPTKYHGKYERGLFNIKDVSVYVNRGIGFKKLPIRFNSRPEITLLTLRKC